MWEVARYHEPHVGFFADAYVCTRDPGEQAADRGGRGLAVVVRGAADTGRHDHARGDSGTVHFIDGHVFMFINVRLHVRLDRFLWRHEPKREHQEVGLTKQHGHKGDTNWCPF